MGENMPHRTSHVRTVRKCTKAEVSGKLAAGWARVSSGRKGEMADALDSSVKTIDRALTGETLPELHTALNSLAFDPSALAEVFDLMGLEVRPKRSTPANDLATIASICNLAGQFTAALEDGHRDHRETCQLADAIRPLLVALSAICAEADAVRAA